MTKPKYLHAPGVGQYAAKRTQQEVALIMGLTPQRVSQIERQAIMKIKKFLLYTSVPILILGLIGCVPITPAQHVQNLKLEIDAVKVGCYIYQTNQKYPRDSGLDTDCPKLNKP